MPASHVLTSSQLNRFAISFSHRLLISFQLLQSSPQLLSLQSDCHKVRVFSSSQLLGSSSLSLISKFSGAGYVLLAVQRKKRSWLGFCFLLCVFWWFGLMGVHFFLVYMQVGSSWEMKMTACVVCFSSFFYVFFSFLSVHMIMVVICMVGC